MVKFEIINDKKSLIIADLTNKDINDWVNEIGFDLSSDFEKKVTIYDCKINIINKSLKYSKKKSLRISYAPGLLDKREDLLSNNIISQNGLNLIKNQNCLIMKKFYDSNSKNNKNIYNVDKDEKEYDRKNNFNDKNMNSNYPEKEKNNNNNISINENNNDNINNNNFFNNDKNNNFNNNILEKKKNVDNNFLNNNIDINSNNNINNIRKSNINYAFNDYQNNNINLNNGIKNIPENSTNNIISSNEVNSLKNQNYIYEKKIKKLENKLYNINKELENEKKSNKTLIDTISSLNKILKEKEKKIKYLEEICLKEEQIKYNEKDFINEKEISKGGCGTLFSADNIKDNIEICLKKIDINFLKNLYKMNKYPEESYLQDLDDEIKILKLLSQNQNSVKYYGSYDIIKEKVIIMEKCDENLEQFIFKRKKALEVKEIKEIFLGLNEVFYIMYKNNIIHRDLKLKNFLVKYVDKTKQKFIVKLSDYGIGKFLKNINSSFSGIKGTPETIAPEVLLSKVQKYENLVDIFSLGIVFYQLSHNLKHPYNENFQFNYYLYYDKDNYNIQFDENIKDKDFKDLLSKMLKLNPKNRLTWEEYFKHKFFKKKLLA